MITKEEAMELKRKLLEFEREEERKKLKKEERHNIEIVIARAKLLGNKHINDYCSVSDEDKELVVYTSVGRIMVCYDGNLVRGYNNFNPISWRADLVVKFLIERLEKVDDLEILVSELKNPDYIGSNSLLLEKGAELIRANMYAGLFENAKDLSRSLSAEYKKIAADESKKEGYEVRAREYIKAAEKFEKIAEYMPSIKDSSLSGYPPRNLARYKFLVEYIL